MHFIVLECIVSLVLSVVLALHSTQQSTQYKTPRSAVTQIHTCSTQTTVVSVGTILDPDRLTLSLSHCSDPTYTYMDWLGDNHIHSTLHAHTQH